jgi:transcriptional regulator with XRE-family HTH domain
MNNNIAIELGKRIRTLRKLKGLTQESLGEKSGISYKFINKSITKP